MPMTPAQMERRIVQNTNDIESIYDLLRGIDGTLKEHGTRLVSIDTRLDEVLTMLRERREPLS